MKGGSNLGLIEWQRGWGTERLAQAQQAHCHRGSQNDLTALDGLKKDIQRKGPYCCIAAATCAHLWAGGVKELSRKAGAGRGGAKNGKGCWGGQGRRLRDLCVVDTAGRGDWKQHPGRWTDHRWQKGLLGARG